MDNVQVLVDNLTKTFPGKINSSEDNKGLIVTKDEIVTVLKELKENSDFTFLADLTAVDYPENFTVVYHLMSMKDARILRISVLLTKDNPKVDSISSLWKSADVMERETFDLMGIVFEGHPDLKRILCPDDFEGHPLRKDYKIENVAR